MELLELLLGLLGEFNILGTVDGLGNRVDLVFNRVVFNIVKLVEIAWLISQFDNFLSQVNRTFTAFSPGIGQNHVDP